MATLGSPGVQVSVIDESFYTPSAPGTIPLIFVATAQDKSNASGTGTAQGTTAANAGKVWVITSQRDLTDTFGTPTFYTDVNGNSVHGGELNEYGLQAAYSLLGASSRAYIARANVDLGALTPSTSYNKFVILDELTFKTPVPLGLITISPLAIPTLEKLITLLLISMLSTCN